jgi:hypothetical protein
MAARPPFQVKRKPSCLRLLSTSPTLPEKNEFLLTVFSFFIFPPHCSPRGNPAILLPPPLSCPKKETLLAEFFTTANPSPPPLQPNPQSCVAHPRN